MLTQRRNKLRITQTLLSAWQYSFISDSGYEDFLGTLYRDKKPPTQAMLDGQHFENIVNAHLDGEKIPSDCDYANCVEEITQELWGAQQQVSLFKDLKVGGEDILIHGVLDFLKAGVIHDTKFSKTYDVGKYFDSPQAPMYLELVPEAYKFQYIICDGKYVYRETYRRGDQDPIEVKVEQFLNYLDKHQLFEIFEDKWRIKN